MFKNIILYIVIVKNNEKWQLEFLVSFVKMCIRPCMVLVPSDKQSFFHSQVTREAISL